MLSVLIFALQISLFGAVALSLHRMSDFYGFAPLLFFVAGIMGILNIIELMTLFIEPSPNIVIRPGGHVYVPIILLTVLLIYISSGTRTAQITIVGLIGIDVLILSVLVFLMLYLNVRDDATVITGLLAERDILTFSFARGVLGSTIAFMVDMFVIIVVYQGIKNAFPFFPDNLIPAAALLVALWVDAVLFNLLGYLGTAQFVSGIPSDVLMKTVAGLLLAPMTTWYVTRIASTLVSFQGANNRATFAIFSAEGDFLTRFAQLEGELQVSRAIYEQLLHHIEEIFWLVDIEQRRLLYLSPNFEKLTGKSPEGYYQNPRALLDLVHPEDRAENIRGQVFLEPESEFRIQREDGSIRWLRNRSFPIVTEDQRKVRYAGVTEDITLRREAQTHAFALELSQEKMRLLHRFVQDASHDLRTPLSAMMLKLDLIEKVDDTRRQQLQKELYEVAQHLNTLIDDLFTLSHIESEEQVGQVSLDFNDMVQLASNEHQDIAQAAGLTFAVNISQQAISILGNPDQLYRLVANLIGNAIHYTQQGTVTITTRIEADQAVLEVSDTGIGIAPNHIDAIFERFYRTDSARDMRYEGTGLGLAISKAIVEQHGGSISLQSTLSQGTTFYVFFPLAKNVPA